MTWRPAAAGLILAAMLCSAPAHAGDTLIVGDPGPLAPYFSTSNVLNARDSRTFTPLMLASAAGDVESVRALLSYGADPDITTASGNTALMQAPDAAVMRLLLAYKAAPDARNEAGITALMSAAKRGDIESVRALLEAGADLNLTDTMGATALHFAAQNGNVEVSALLVSYGAVLDVRDNACETPLMRSIDHMKDKAARALIHSGAEKPSKGKSRPSKYNGLTKRECKDKTALSYARTKGLSEIVVMIEALEAVR